MTAFKWNVFCLSSSPERSGPAATLQPRDSPPYGTVRFNANCSNRLAGLAGWFGWLVGWLLVECEAAHLGSSIKPPRAPREGGSIRKERQARGKEELPVEPVWAAHWPESDAGFGFDHKCRKSPPRFLQSHIFNPNFFGSLMLRRRLLWRSRIRRRHLVDNLQNSRRLFLPLKWQN